MGRLKNMPWLPTPSPQPQIVVQETAETARAPPVYGSLLPNYNVVHHAHVMTAKSGKLTSWGFSFHGWLLAYWLRLGDADAEITIDYTGNSAAAVTVTPRQLYDDNWLDLTPDCLPRIRRFDDINNVYIVSASCVNPLPHPESRINFIVRPKVDTDVEIHVFTYERVRL